MTVNLNTADREEIKKFLKDNEWLTTFEIAAKAGVHPRTVREWKKLLNTETKLPHKVNFRRPYKMKRRELPPTVTDPKIWRNKEWLEEHYINKQLGILQIARIVSKDRAHVYYYLKKFGIQTRKPHSDYFHNDYNNKEWLEEHYIEKRWSLHKCAKKAGVNRYTICNWLSKHNIPIRDCHEASLGNKVHNVEHKKSKPGKRWKKPRSADTRPPEKTIMGLK